MISIDESQLTLPQSRGMYAGDRSRKKTLVEYGFRLPSALDNRPLNFGEFESKIDQMLFVSATPSDYEKDHELMRVELPVVVREQLELSLRKKTIRIMTLGVHTQDTIRQKKEFLLHSSTPTIHQDLWHAQQTKALDLRTEQHKAPVHG